MKTAIICPISSKDPYPRLIDELVKKTWGDALRIIGGKDSKDLSKYDRLIVVYPYPLDTVNKDFEDFCGLYENEINQATLVVSFPVTQTKKVSDMDIHIGRVNRFVSEFWSKYADPNARKTVVLNATGDVKKFTEAYASKASCDCKAFSKDSFSINSYSVAICPYFSSVTVMMSRKNANLYIILGVVAICLGIPLTIMAPRAFTVFFIGVMLIGGGIAGRRANIYGGNKAQENEKIKELAAILSVYPGLGHIYLGHKKIGYVCIILTTMSLLIPVALLINGIFTPLIYGITLWVSLVFWTMLDVDELFINEILSEWAPTSYVFYDTAIKPSRIGKYKKAVVVVSLGIITAIALSALNSGVESYLNVFVVIIAIVAILLTIIPRKITKI